MNKERRISLQKTVAILETAKDLLDDIVSDESDAKDALEERFSETERFSWMENNVDVLESARDDLESIIDSLQEVG